MIILEGPDGAGKTTLIKHLAKLYDMPVAARVVDQNTNPLTDLRIWVEENLEKDKRYPEILYDRHRLISEPIYSLAVGGNREERFWDFDWLRTQVAEFYSLKPLVIWCMPKFDVVEQNCAGTENEFVRPFIGKIYRGYMAEMARWTALWEHGQQHQMVYDYTQHDMAQWLEHFELTYKEWKNR